MRLHLSKIKAFSQCPAYYNFTKDLISITPSHRVSIFTKLIQRCYQKQLQTRKLVNWRNLLSWVDTEVFRYINISEEDAYDKAKSLTDSIVHPLNAWYFNYYKPFPVEAYINVPVKQIIGGIEVYDICPVIKISDPISIVIVADKPYTQIQLYNDIHLRGLLYLLAQQLETPEIKADYFLLGATRRLEHLSIKSSEKLNKRTESSIAQISNAILNKVCYPSITTMCDNCQFFSECIL